MLYAAYPDQAGDTFLDGCRTLKNLGIKNVALRNYDNQPILLMSDAACQECLQILTEFGLNVMSICGDAGNRHPTYIAGDKDKVKRSVVLANYFKAEYIRIWPGKLGKNTDVCWPKLHSFLLEVDDAATKSGLKWCIEPNYSSYLSFKANRAVILENMPDCKYVYDPVAMALGQKINAHNYYNEIAKNVVMIDLRDMVCGVGMCPVGQGEMDWKTVLPKVKDKNIIAVFDPSLGYRYKDVQGKAEIFKYAFDGYYAFLKSLN